MRRICWGLLLAAMTWPCAALADEFEQGVATLWEVLWHQSGTPTRIVRWENDIRVRIHGVNLAAHREHTLTALRAVTAEAGINLTDVSGQPDADRVANLTVEITPDNQLEDNQPCVTFLDFKSEAKIDTAVVQMRSKDAWRCAYHEAMHVMGVRGHPAGQTVLSYFPWKVNELMPLDKVMLRAWYSPRMTGGMTPFEALPILADELVATMPNRTAAAQARDAFFAATIQQMHAYANGQGEFRPSSSARARRRRRHPLRPQRDELLPGHRLPRRRHRAARRDAGREMAGARRHPGQPRRAN